MEARCPFCSVDECRIVASNETALALRDAFPVSRGHTRVVPRRHATRVFDLPIAENNDLWQLVGIVRKQLARELSPHGFNIGFNEGEAAGQTVEHAHVHIVPRYRDDVVDPRGGVRWVLPEKANYTSR
jgi:diadenosine tetraphosphate (Ap4A) HIT family hydrolase